MELLDLIHNIVEDERRVDLEIETMIAPGRVVPEYASDVASRMDYSFKRLESYMEILRSAHRDYVGKVKRYTAGDKEGRDHVLKGFDAFLKGFEGRVLRFCLGENFSSTGTVFRNLRPGCEKNLRPITRRKPEWI